MNLPMARLRWLALPLVTGLSACASGPDTRSLIYGDRADDADPDQYDVLIIAADGEMMFGEEQTRLRLKPGFHYLEIATTKEFPGRELVRQPFAIEVKPCMRYQLVAQHESKTLKSAWRVVVKKEEANEACVAGGDGR